MKYGPYPNTSKADPSRKTEAKEIKAIKPRVRAEKAA
jgi:hypothetical protein